MCITFRGKWLENLGNSMLSGLYETTLMVVYLAFISGSFS